jgi:hypothetical protein
MTRQILAKFHLSSQYRSCRKQGFSSEKIGYMVVRSMLPENEVVADIRSVMTGIRSEPGVCRRFKEQENWTSYSVGSKAGSTCFAGRVKAARCRALAAAFVLTPIQDGFLYMGLLSIRLRSHSSLMLTDTG